MNKKNTSEQETTEENGIKGMLDIFGAIFLLYLMCLPTLFIANFGKLWAAHVLGIGVKTFNIGEGVSLLSWDVNSVAYTIHLFPFGADLEYVNAVPTSLLLQSLVVISGAIIPLLFAYVLVLIFMKSGYTWCKELTTTTLVWLCNKIAFTFFIPFQLEEKRTILSFLKSESTSNKILDFLYGFCFLSIILALIPIHLSDDFFPIITQLVGVKAFNMLLVNLVIWVVLRWIIHSIQTAKAEQKDGIDE